MGTPVRIIIARCIVAILLFWLPFPASLDMDGYNHPSSGIHFTDSRLSHML